MKLKSVIITVFVLANSGIYSQPLSELLGEASNNNLELKVLETDYFAMLEKVPQVGQLPNPELAAGFFVLPVETRLGGQVARLSATQMLPWFGTLSSKKKLELAKANASQKRIEARALNIAEQVKQAYFQLYEIIHSQTIIKRSIALLESMEAIALAKVESGKTTLADVLTVQIKIKALQQELEILETNKVHPTAILNHLLDRPLDQSLTIRDSLSFVEIPYNKDSLTEKAAARHPAIEMIGLQQEISEQNKVVNTFSGKPSLGFGLDYILVNERTDAQPSSNGRDIIQVRTSLKVPLYRGKYEAKENEENLKIQSLEYQRKRALSEFESTIERAFADYENARLKLNLYKEQQKIARSALNILESNYSARGGSFDELLRLEKDLIEYDLNILSVIVRSHIIKARIDALIQR